MRDCHLVPGDPLSLTLAADFRLSEPDYTNDHIWELEIGGGDPPALVLSTTYGLRARSMRIFPRLTLEGKAVQDPAAFAAPPCVRCLYPNFLIIAYAPFPSVEVAAEYWIPSSQAAAGRLTLTNRTGGLLNIGLELCGLLLPLDGRSLAPTLIQSVNVLAGHTADLEPVLFLTGGPQAGPGPYPSLLLNLALEPGAARTLTWSEAALGNLQQSFELARRVAARPWQAERAKIELLNGSQTVEIRTGDLEWDAAFALSQKAAFGLFFGSNERLPHPSFVLARRPDHGYSRRGDGNDYSHLWSGQTPLEAYYLASLLPGAPQLAKGLLLNFLAAGNDEGFVDGRPGLGGQRGHWLAAPLLASLAWEIYQRTEDRQFLLEIFPRLLAFYRQWFSAAHDRDADGFPEWDHFLQSGFEDNPAYSPWQAWGQGADISCVESPDLGAMLYREGHSLAQMASLLGLEHEREPVELLASAVRLAVEECWDSETASYHVRDRDSHLCPAGTQLGRKKGTGVLSVGKSFGQPTRLLVAVQFEGEATRHPVITLKGQLSRQAQVERMEKLDFQWGAGRGVATSKGLFTSLRQVEIFGLTRKDQVIVSTMDFTAEDHTLLLPLWAEIPNLHRVRTLVSRTLFAAERFGRPFGIPALLSPLGRPGQGSRRSAVDLAAESFAHGVHLPWNHLIGEGLLAYGLREEAARLTAHLMSAIIENLKRRRAFFQTYHAENGAGGGERNLLHGLAPLGLFLDVLGVQFVSPLKVHLSGKNPFPWPIVVQYRGTRVTRRLDETEIVFANGQTVVLNDPTDAMVCLDR